MYSPCFQHLMVIWKRLSCFLLYLQYYMNAIYICIHFKCLQFTCCKKVFSILVRLSSICLCDFSMQCTKFSGLQCICCSGTLQLQSCYSCAIAGSLQSIVGKSDEVFQAYSCSSLQCNHKSMVPLTLNFLAERSLARCSSLLP